MTRFLILLLCLAFAPFARSQPVAAPVARTLDAGWQFRLMPGDGNAKAHRRAARWLPATVPGSVQTDLMAARLLADPWQGEGERAAQWVGLSDWQYRNVFTVDAAMLARRDVDLVFDAPVTIGAQRIKGETMVTLISDRRTAFRATWRLRVLDRDGAVLSARGGDVEAAPLAATPLAAITDAELLGTADSRRTVAVADLTVDGKVIARQFSYFSHARELALTDPGLHATLAAAPGGGYALTVSARALARGVGIEFGDLDAALSDNAFDLAAGDSVILAVTSGASLGALRRALSVRSLYGATK